MAKYHINAQGNTGICHAQEGGCPFGGESEHFSTEEDARKAFEKFMGGGPWVTHKKASVAQALPPVPAPGVGEEEKNPLTREQLAVEIGEAVAKVGSAHARWWAMRAEVDSKISAGNGYDFSKSEEVNRALREAEAELMGKRETWARLFEGDPEPSLGEVA